MGRGFHLLLSRQHPRKPPWLLLFRRLFRLPRLRWWRSIHPDLKGWTTWAARSLRYREDFSLARMLRRRRSRCVRGGHLYLVDPGSLLGCPTSRLPLTLGLDVSMASMKVGTTDVALDGDFANILGLRPILQGRGGPWSTWTDGHFVVTRSTEDSKSPFPLRARRICLSIVDVHAFLRVFIGRGLQIYSLVIALEKEILVVGGRKTDL